MKAEIEKALAPLVGLDLVAVGGATDIESVTFGRHSDSADSETELAPFALLIYCAWRLLASGKVFTGSADCYRPASEDTADEDFEKVLVGSAMLDVRHRELREQLEQTAHSVLAVEADPFGGVRVQLSSDLALEIFPNVSSAEGEDVEFWRVFQPGLDYSHFVVSTAGTDRVSNA